MLHDVATAVTAGNTLLGVDLIYSDSLGQYQLSQSSPAMAAIMDG